MKCDRCDSPATVHEVTIRNGTRVERHLCEQCARGGRPDHAAPGDTPPPSVGAGGTGREGVGASLPTIVGPSGAAVTGPGERAPAQACPDCGLSYMQFKHDGMLGCPGCYDAFLHALGPLLERAHEGGTHHVGRGPGGVKAPGAGDGGGEAGEICPGRRADAARRAASLREALASALGAEEYERAARLRDELRRIEADLGQRPEGRP